MPLSPEQQARNWLNHHGISPTRLTRMSGYTNHVFLVEQMDKAYPVKSVLRLADRSLETGLCPLADQSGAVIAKYRDAEQLGLAPRVIVADTVADVMWLEYAGVRRVLGHSAFVDIREMLSRLHGSTLQWGTDSTAENLQKQLLVLRDNFSGYRGEGEVTAILPRDQFLQDSIDNLLRSGEGRGYFDWPKAPVHSDLNPGNWLHDGSRWWLIDWDFAGMYPALWDYASLIVEHDWDEAIAIGFIPDVVMGDLAWFCSHFALLSWDWHRQRGTEAAILQQKRQQCLYWLGRV